MSYYCHSTVPLSAICNEYYHIDKDTVDNLIFLHAFLPDVWSSTYMKTFTNIIMDLTCQKTSLLWSGTQRIDPDMAGMYGMSSYQFAILP